MKCGGMTRNIIVPSVAISAPPSACSFLDVALISVMRRMALITMTWSTGTCAPRSIKRRVCRPPILTVDLRSSQRGRLIPLMTLMQVKVSVRLLALPVKWGKRLVAASDEERHTAAKWFRLPHLKHVLPLAGHGLLPSWLPPQLGQPSLIRWIAVCAGEHPPVALYSRSRPSVSRRSRLTASVAPLVCRFPTVLASSAACSTICASLRPSSSVRLSDSMNSRSRIFSSEQTITSRSRRCSDSTSPNLHWVARLRSYVMKLSTSSFSCWYRQ